MHVCKRMSIVRNDYLLSARNLFITAANIVIHPVYFKVFITIYRFWRLFGNCWPATVLATEKCESLYLRCKRKRFAFNEQFEDLEWVVELYIYQCCFGERHWLKTSNIGLAVGDLFYIRYYSNWRGFHSSDHYFIHFECAPRLKKIVKSEKTYKIKCFF